MSVNAIVVLCAQVLFAHAVISQYCRSGSWGLITPSAGHASSCGSQIGNGYALGGGLGIDIGSGAGFSGAGIEATLTNGGAFPVHSVTSIAPSGISVASENAYEGSLNVIGELPFLSAIAFEGVLPSAGTGAVHYGCGNGITAITSEVGNSAGAIGFGSAGIGPGVAGYGSTYGHSGMAALNFGQAAGGRCGCGLY